MNAPLLQVTGVSVRYALGGSSSWSRRWLTAVDSASFRLAAGETLGLVGESGCGKSTLGRALLGLAPVHAGSVLIAGERMDQATGRRLRALRRNIQMVFQDPLASLDPRMTVGESIAEPLTIYEPELGRKALRLRVADMLERVGLAHGHADRYPHEFSGGQCQRVGIARAIVLRPGMVVCDEPVSALDVSVQGQVVNLLAELQRDLGLAYLFISHNLAVIRHVSRNVMVMYLGQTIEAASRDALYERPLHPYTRGLLDSVPAPEPGPQRTGAAPLAGELPSPLRPPLGCVFSTRCPMAQARCRERRPELVEASAGHRVACHRWPEWPDGLKPASFS
jgi:oligopeptide transport system ATP-binding protein